MTLTYCPPSTTEVERLTRMAGDDRRDMAAAVHLAQEARAAFDPEEHNLTPGRRHHPFFRLVAGERFRACRNIGLASKVLDILLEEAP